MKLIIAGGNGFLGKAVEKYFESKGFEVLILTRNPTKSNHIQWDAKHLGDWQWHLENADVLINLVGKSVDCRYTEKNKSEILNSRLNSTKILNEAILASKNGPKIWFNSSSATTYIHSENVKMTESNGIVGNDFSMSVCKKWEQEFFKGHIDNCRKVALRTAIVLGNEGGAYPRLRTIVKAFLGGKQGQGNQRFSWIHIEDFCEAIDFIIKSHNLNGPINLSSPNPIKNQELMHALRKRYRVFFGIPLPKLLLSIGAFLIGTEKELLLKSRFVYPEKLLENGFEFKFPFINEAIYDLK